MVKEREGDMEYPNIFNRCIVVLLGKDDKHLGLEGGYSNKKSDSGGETRWGISKRSYPNLDIKTLTKEKAINIYYTDFWIPMNLDLLMDDDLILLLFCFGVNSGIRTSIMVLQNMVGIDDDGYIGSVTARAVREFNGDVAIEFAKRQKLFYVTLAQRKPKERVNLNGWLVRVQNTHF